MKPPPLLLAAALLFWGWQADMFNVGATMAILLESSRLTKVRWEFSDEDFARLWTFCTILFLGTAVYAFTLNEGPSHFWSFFSNPNSSSVNSASNAGAQAAASFFRWLPITFFLFVAAQTFGSREEIPINTISIIMRWRWKRAAKLGRPLPVHQGVNVGYPYFAICLFSASIHSGEGSHYFPGLCVLMAWGLWMQRSQRFGVAVWLGALVAVLLLGFAGQIGIAQLAGYLGRWNPQLVARLMHSRGPDPLQNATRIGSSSRLNLSGKIVLRVEPKAGPVPTYLREATYRAYGDRSTWLALSDDMLNVAKNTNDTTWYLVPGKTNNMAITISAYLAGEKGLLPLPENCGQLENLPAWNVQNNSVGSVLAEGPGLVIFDALYGNGPQMDSPPDDSVQEMGVVDIEKPAIRQVISEMQLANTNLDTVLRGVQNFFQTKFVYSTSQPRDRSGGTNLTALGRFLLRTRRGHCEYFATATVLILRELHIPARYSIGYFVHETSGTGYVVRERDAHAWCIVWNGKGWQDFDTTPASWIEEESRRRSVFQWLSDAWSWIGFQFSKFRWGQGHLRRYLLITLLPVLVTLLIQIFYRKRRQRERDAAADGSCKWPGLDSEFYLIERKLSARGVPRQAAEPLTAWLERSTNEPSLAEIRKPLRNLLRLHYQCRFDPDGLSQRDREELRHGTRSVLESLGRN